MRTLDHGEHHAFPLVGHESRLAVHRQRGAGRIPGDELHPAIHDEPFHGGHAVERSLDLRDRSLDHDQQPHRLVDLHGLPGQAGSQIAGMAVHHADQAGDVVRQFRAAAIAPRVDARKHVGEIDPGADRSDRRQCAGENLGARIRFRIIGDKKCAAVEEQPAGAGPPADDADGVGRMAVFRPHLREVARPALDPPQRLRRRDGQRHRVEPPAPLLRVERPRPLADGAKLGRSGAVTGRHLFRVVKQDCVGTGVVHATDEPRAVGNHEPGGREPRTHAGIVRHRGEGPGIGAAAAAAAGPAVVGALVGIVEARGAMADHGHERGEAGREPDVFEHAGDDPGHLVNVEAGVRAVGQRRTRGPLEFEPRGNPAAGEIGSLVEKRGSEPWKGHAGHEWHGRDRAADGGEQAAAKERAAARRHAVLELAELPPHRLPAAVVGEGVGLRHLDHRVAGTHHDRTQRRGMPVVETAVIHRHREEAGGAKRLEPRPLFLEMAAERFAPFVDAEDRLHERPHAATGGHRRSAVRRQRVEHLDSVVALVGQMKESPSHHAVEAVDRLLEPDELVFVEPADVGSGEPHQFRHLVEQEGAGHAARRMA